ncbi:g11814 [Coccomyxa elongata]
MPGPSTAKRTTGPLTRRATQAKGAPIPVELPQRPKRRAADTSVREAYLATKSPSSPCIRKETKTHSEVSDEFASPRQRRVVHARQPAGRACKASLTPPQTPSDIPHISTVRSRPDSGLPDSQSCEYPALAAAALLDRYWRPRQAAPQPRLQPRPAHRTKRKFVNEAEPVPVDYLAQTLKRRVLDAFAREQLSAGVGCWKNLPDCDLPLKKRRCFHTVVTTVTEVEYTTS